METKICQTCGRTIEYRKKWAKVWDAVKYCSENCRTRRNREDFREAILDLLHTRPRTSTICPSEVLAPPDKQNRDLMEKVRAGARLLVAEGKIEILQNGRVVDPSAFRGPIRLRLKDSG